MVLGTLATAAGAYLGAHLGTKAALPFARRVVIGSLKRSVQKNPNDIYALHKALAKGTAVSGGGALAGGIGGGYASHKVVKLVRRKKQEEQALSLSALDMLKAGLRTARMATRGALTKRTFGAAKSLQGDALLQRGYNAAVDTAKHFRSGNVRGFYSGLGKGATTAAKAGMGASAARATVNHAKEYGGNAAEHVTRRLTRRMFQEGAHKTIAIRSGTGRIAAIGVGAHLTARGIARLTKPKEQALSLSSIVDAAKATYGALRNGLRKAAPVVKSFFNRATAQGRSAFKTARTGGQATGKPFSGQADAAYKDFVSGGAGRNNSGGPSVLSIPHAAVKLAKRSSIGGIAKGTALVGAGVVGANALTKRRNPEEETLNKSRFRTL